MEPFGQAGQSHLPDAAYWLYDTFSVDRAAGAVNGTQADGVGGLRTVVDTNMVISIIGEFDNQGYYLFDQFTTVRSSGAIGLTNAEPIGGTRSAIDTNSKISIT